MNAKSIGSWSASLDASAQNEQPLDDAADDFLYVQLRTVAVDELRGTFEIGGDACGRPPVKPCCARVLDRKGAGVNLAEGALRLGAIDSKENIVTSRAVRSALGAIAALFVAATNTACAATPENVAYVSSPAGVTVIDLARLEPIKEIDVGGKGPRGLGVTPDGKYLLTANQGSADVSVIDTATFKVVRRIPVGKNPEFMRIQPDGKVAYVTYEPAVVGGPPKKGEKEEEGGSPAEVAAVNLEKASASSFLMGGKETEGIEFSPDGKYIVVANEGNDTVAIYDKASGSAIKTVNIKPYGTRPRGVKISPDGRTYVVTMENSNNLVLLDPDFKFIKSVPTDQGPYGVTFDRAGKRILIAAARSKTLQVFDAQTLARIAAVPLGERCWHFTFTPDDTKIIAACGRSNDVHIIDAATYKPLKVISGIKLPWGVVTYPKAFGSLDSP